MTRTYPAPPRCRTCREAIRFVVMATGRAMPVRIEADPEGIIAARWDGARFADGRVLKRGDPIPPAGWKRFRPHWADCEKAGKPVPERRAPRPRTDFLF